MSHIEEHCTTPITTFKRDGRVYACTCGKIYRLTKHHSMAGTYKAWECIDDLARYHEGLVQRWLRQDKEKREGKGKLQR